MLSIFRNTSPYTAIVLLIVTILLKLYALLHPVVPVAIEGSFFYNQLLQWLNVLFKDNAFAYTLFAAFNTFFQGLLLNRIANKYRLLSRVGYLPALSYILFSSVYTSFNYFSLPLLLVWILLGSIHVIASFGQTLQPRKQIFNAGFLLCMAAMLQFSAVGYFLFLLVCLIILRPFNISEWVVGFMGYFTPIYFTACILYLIDRTDILYQMPRLSLLLPVKIDWRILSLICGLVILCFSGLYAVQLQSTRNSVYVRRNWIAIAIFLILSIVVAAFTDTVIKASWLVAIPALSLLISNTFSLEKSKWFSNFAFYFSLVFVVYCQWIIK